MSQPSFQVQDPTWLSIPFAKFSHDTSPNGTRKIPWIHVAARNDLDFNIRNVRVEDEHHRSFANRTFMKITAGAELLVRWRCTDLQRFLSI